MNLVCVFSIQVCCSGHGKNGALTVLQQSIRPDTITQVCIPPLTRYVWLSIGLCIISQVGSLLLFMMAVVWGWWWGLWVVGIGGVEKWMGRDAYI